MDVKDMKSISLISRGPPPAGTRPLGIETWARGLMCMRMTILGMVSTSQASKSQRRRIGCVAIACIAGVSICAAASSAVVTSAIAAAVGAAPLCLGLPCWHAADLLPIRCCA